MNKIVFIAVNNGGKVSSIKNAQKIAVYDADEHKIIAEIDNPYHKGFWLLEELFDQYDPSVLITAELEEELIYDIEENGVKVFISRKKNITDLLDELFV